MSAAFTVEGRTVAVVGGASESLPPLLRIGGADVTLVLPGENDRYGRVATDGSYASASDPRLVFALGEEAVHKGFTPLSKIYEETMVTLEERAGGKAGNKGWEAAMAAVEMVNLMDAVGAQG